MKVTDVVWVELARKAGVRPPHLFHCWSFRKAMGERFSAEGYAAFAMMEQRHVEAMISVLDAIAVPAKPKREAVRSQLAEGWVMPEEWVVMGRELRFWTMDVCRTEADKFINWHRAKGSSFACWKSAWRNWVTGSHREDGSAKPGAEPMDRKTYLTNTSALYRRMGRAREAEDMEREAATL